MTVIKGKAVIISAPSGAGKSTISNYLLEKSNKLEFSISATTRKPRGLEKNGVEYYFLSIPDFKRKIKNGEFIEWEEVYKGQYYGTLKSEMDRIWSNGRHVLFDVDVKGGISLKKNFGNKSVSVFIMPPSPEELEKRLINRATDDPEKIKMRLKKASEEIKLANQFDNIVINNLLEKAEEEVLNIVSSFLSKEN